MSAPVRTSIKPQIRNKGNQEEAKPFYLAKMKKEKFWCGCQSGARSTARPRTATLMPKKHCKQNPCGQEQKVAELKEKLLSLLHLVVAEYEMKGYKFRS